MPDNQSNILAIIGLVLIFAARLFSSPAVQALSAALGAALLLIAYFRRQRR